MMISLNAIARINRIHGPGVLSSVLLALPCLVSGCTQHSAAGMAAPCRRDHPERRGEACVVADRTIHRPTIFTAYDTRLRIVQMRWSYHCSRQAPPIRVGGSVLAYAHPDSSGRQLYHYHDSGPPGRRGRGTFTFNITGAREFSLYVGILPSVPVPSPPACAIRVKVVGKG